jgi:hypothetical protein
MFCIAAFIILVILSIFSAKYRKLLGKSWGCVARRVTFRPCDTNFKEEIKSKLLSKVALKKPKLVKAADIGLEVGAVLVILLTAWSLYVVVKSGLNLYVYGTCNPSNSSSCSLGAEACSIETVKPSFVTSVKTFKVHSWVATELKSFGKTVSNIPTRLQKWEPKDYIPDNATYQQKYDNNKPTALEIIDPGCQFCKELYGNQKTANFSSHYNLTYIAYPIPSSSEKSGYKFANSLLVTKYLEAMKLQPLKDASVPADWQIIERMFTWQDNDKVAYQIRFNAFYSNDEAKTKLEQWAKEIGYSDSEVTELATLASSQKVADIIAANRKTVEDKVKTVKIPTSIFDGRRHDGVVSAEDLKR